MKTRKYITTKMMESIPACEDDLKAFHSEFPSGRATWQQVVEMAGKSDDCAEYVAWLGRVCPDGVVGATWAARRALQRNGKELSRLGQACPAGVAGWEERLALQRNDEDRAMLGQVCPDGVVGATLEARMAVQHTVRDRNYVMAEFREKKGGE